MSEYQRFISYMYEYRNGKKSTNCGYARVENRNRLCRLEIHMKTSPQALEEPLRIYGCFHRDGRLFGVLLGQHAPVLDMVNWRYQGDPDSLNASQVPLSQLEGLILSDGSQIAYCSMWNDTVIDPNQMTPYAKEDPAETRLPMRENEILPEETSSRSNAPAVETHAPDTLQAASDLPPEDTAETPDFSSADTAAAPLLLQTAMADSPDPLSPDMAGISDTPKTNSADFPEAPRQNSRESTGSPQAAPPAASRTDAVSRDKTAAASRTPSASADKAVSAASSFSPDDALPDPESAEFSGEAIPDTPLSAAQPDNGLSRDPSPDSRIQTTSPGSGTSENLSPGEEAPADVPGTVSANPKSSDSRESESNLADAALVFQQKQTNQKPAAQAPGLSASSSAWEQVQAAYPRINPFTDDEIQDCVRVELSDLPTLRQNGWRIAGNRFILHSFQKNRHLVLGRLKNNGRYIFAVPGYYDNQERFMANMFGFPYFKSSDGGPLRYGQKGYWYRLLY